MSKSILIVDDDKRIRELLEDYLSEKKYKIYLSEDFADAKEILEYFVFDLIIVDRMMPSGDGIDLIKTINLSNEDFIHLNCGLHDLGRPEPLIKNMLSKKQVNITEYAENLEKIFAFIRNKEAVVLWGSTTPVEEISVFRNRGWQQRLTKDVELYNIVAKRICHERNIQINDIYAKILPEHKHLLLKDGVHFSEEGYKVLGKIVSESIVQVFEDLFK